MKIPQSSILYQNNPSYKFSKFLPVKETKKPEIGIYLSNLDDEYSEVVIEDHIFIVTNNNIFPYREEKNVN